MLYAKIIYTGVADYTNASERQTMVSGDKFDFVPNHEGRPALCVYRGSELIEMIDLYGDVWIMNEAGKTISQYAIPSSFLNKGVV